MKLCRDPNILMFGHCHGVHVFPLALALKTRLLCSMSVFELIRPGKEAVIGDLAAVFDEVYSTADHLTLAHLVGLFFQRPVLRSLPSAARTTAKLALFSLTARAKLGRVQRQAQQLQRLNKFQRIQDQFDLFHLHFIAPRMAEFVSLLPKSAKLLVSIWGSDLLRVAGTENYRRQLQICQRASIITVRSIEMKEILLAKFGREFEPKVRIVKFGSSLITMIRNNDLASLRRELRNEFKLNDDQLVVCLGHNGFRENQHAEVLTALEKLSDRLKQRLVFFAPMTYGADSGYAQMCEAVAKEKRLNLYIFRKFMPPSDIVRLRAGSDIMIHVPVSDALSGAMCETIFCGNVAIAGRWLQYGELRRRNVYYREVSSIAEIPELLETIVCRIVEEKARAAASAERIREVLDWDLVIDEWAAAYRELLGGSWSRDEFHAD
jgi:glycosyltransferase involved in cell wall biosynthesis